MYLSSSERIPSANKGICYPFPQQRRKCFPSLHCPPDQEDHIPWFKRPVILDEKFQGRGVAWRGVCTECGLQACSRQDTLSTSRVISSYDHRWPPMYVLEKPLFDSLALALSILPDTLLTRLVDNCEALPNRLLQIILNNCHSASLYRHCCLLRKEIDWEH